MRCITGAIVQLANPPRSHEGVVLPTRHSWWSHKATVGRSEEKRESAHESGVGHFWTDVQEAHGRVWGIFGSSQRKGLFYYLKGPRFGPDTA